MFEDDPSALEHFDGITRLFPLPNLVMFPFIMQALHIFEPRYREMTADALAGDRLLTIVLLQSGWESSYEGCPAIEAVGCLGRIVADQRLPDGRFDLQLRGLRRVRILEEVEQDRPYRAARVELLQDQGLPGAAKDRGLRKRLVRLIPHWCRGPGPLPELYGKLVRSNIALGTVCDVFTFALPVPLPVKQELLERLDVQARASQLIHFLEMNKPAEGQAEDAAQRFPPDFSVN